MYKFSDYLNICRKEQNITQSELVDYLIEHNDCFESLDTTTLSRWERGISKPSIAKQTEIIIYFSKVFNRVFPFINDADTVDIENSFCSLGFSKLVGKHNLVLNFPTHQMDKAEFSVSLLAESSSQEDAVNRNILMFKELYNKEIDFDKHMAMSLKPANYFSVCTYGGDYYGHLCFIKVKTAIYRKLMRFEMVTEQLKPDDFASEDEQGHLLFYGFFGMSELVMSMLWVHFYSTLIKYQDNVISNGAIIATDGGKKIALGLGLELQSSAPVGDKVFSSYDALTSVMLLNERIVKMLFNPESCPEE